MFLIILFKSIIIGGLVGSAGPAPRACSTHRQHRAWGVSHLGELNSCEGDPASHFSFGLGFFFNARASSVAAGSFTQDVDHRIIPHWARRPGWSRTAIWRKRCTIRKMAIACGIIGMLVVAFSTPPLPPCCRAAGHRDQGAGAGGQPAGEHRDAGDLAGGDDAGRRSGFWAPSSAAQRS